jgi:shikimate dehydrogenase
MVTLPPSAHVALLGYPLAHSVSPAMHHAAAAALGIDLSYELRQVTDPELPRVVQTLRGDPWLGANVTLPHKPAMLRLVDHVTPLAARIGALNTVYKRAGELLGDNTDAPALLRCLREALDLQPMHERVLVLGAGGAARAAIVALLDAGVPSLRVWNRSPERARQLMASLALGEMERASSPGVVEPADLEHACAEATLVVNATSVGLDGRTSPLPDAALDADARIYDLVYGRAGTPLVRRARARGRRAEDGLWMLVYQAARSFELWTRQQPPEQIMYRAAAAALAARGDPVGDAS